MNLPLETRVCNSYSSWNALVGKYFFLSNPGWTSQMLLVAKKPLAKAGDIRDVGSIPELGRSPVGGHGNPLQYSSLENPVDRGA